MKGNRAIIASLILVSANAFAPQQNESKRLTSSVKMADRAFNIDEEFGITLETGRKCPSLGRILMEDTQPGALKWMQNAELKHGRVAMFATFGYMVQKAGVHFPGMLSVSEGISFADISSAASPLDAIQMVPQAGFSQILIVAGLFEARAWNRQYNEGSNIPGDHGYDPLGYTSKGFDNEKMDKMRERELKNGRLAMLTIAAWVSNDLIPGALPVWHP